MDDIRDSDTAAIGDRLKRKPRDTGFVGREVGKGYVKLASGTVISGKTPTARIGQIIGQGASGVVYVAKDFNLLALKRNLALLGDEDPAHFGVTGAKQQRDAEGTLIGYILEEEDKIKIIEDCDIQWDDICKAGAIDMHRMPGNQTVALKMLTDPVKIKRFEKEYRIASALEHKNIIELLGLYKGGDSEGDENFIVMGYLENVKTLKDYIREELETLSLPAKLEIIKQTLDALVFAHEKGAIHRDIKPDNLLIVEDLSKQGVERYLVKVADFGVAKAKEGTSTTFKKLGETVTDEGKVIGTPHYMSPEAARGTVEEAPITAATDVYSTGTTLYELLTKMRPFTAPLDYLLYAYIAEGREPIPVEEHDPSIPASVANLVWLMMAPKPEDRPSSMQSRDILTRARKNNKKEQRSIREIKGDIAAETDIGQKAGLYTELAEATPRPRHATRQMRRLADTIRMLQNKRRTNLTLIKGDEELLEDTKKKLDDIITEHAPRAKTRQHLFMKAADLYKESGSDYLYDTHMKIAAGERRRMAYLAERQGKPKLFTLPRIIGGSITALVLAGLLTGHMTCAGQARRDRTYDSAVSIKANAEDLIRQGKYLEAKTTLENAVLVYKPLTGRDFRFEMEMQERGEFIDTSIADLAKQKDAAKYLADAERKIDDYDFTDASKDIAEAGTLLDELAKSPCRHVRFEELREKRSKLKESIVDKEADIEDLERLIKRLGTINEAIKKKSGELSAETPGFFTRKYIEGLITSKLQRYEEDLRDDINRENVKPSDYIERAFLGYLRADVAVAQLVRTSVDKRAGFIEARLKKVEAAAAALKKDSTAAAYSAVAKEINGLTAYVQPHIAGIRDLDGIDTIIEDGVAEMSIVINSLWEFEGRLKDKDGKPRDISKVELEVAGKVGTLKDTLTGHMLQFRTVLENADSYEMRAGTLSGKLALFGSIVAGKKAYASGDFTAAQTAFEKFKDVQPNKDYLDVLDLEQDAANNATYRVTPNTGGGIGGYDTLMLGGLKRAIEEYARTYDKTKLIPEFEKAAERTGYEIDLNLFKELDGKIPVLDSRRAVLEDDDPKAAELGAQLEQARKDAVGYTGNVYAGVKGVLDKSEPIPPPVLLRELVKKCRRLGETKRADHFQAMIPK